jgi:hypothetical protein
MRVRNVLRLEFAETPFGNLISGTEVEQISFFRSYFRSDNRV